MKTATFALLGGAALADTSGAVVEIGPNSNGTYFKLSIRDYGLGETQLVTTWNTTYLTGASGEGDGGGDGGGIVDGGGGDPAGGDPAGGDPAGEDPAGGDDSSEETPAKPCKGMPTIELVQWTGDANSAMGDACAAQLNEDTSQDYYWFPTRGCANVEDLSAVPPVFYQLGSVSGSSTIQGEGSATQFLKMRPRDLIGSSIGVQIACQNADSEKTVIACAKFTAESDIPASTANNPTPSGWVGQMTDKTGSTFARVSVVNRTVHLEIDSRTIGAYPDDYPESDFQNCLSGGMKMELFTAWTNAVQTSMMGDSCTSGILSGGGNATLLGGLYDPYYSCSPDGQHADDGSEAWDSTRCGKCTESLATLYANNCPTDPTNAVGGLYKCAAGDLYAYHGDFKVDPQRNSTLSTSFNSLFAPGTDLNSLSVRFSCISSGEPMFCGKLDACHSGTVRGEFGATCDGDFKSNEPLDAGTTGEESVVPTPTPTPTVGPTPTPTVGPTPSGTNPTPTPEVVACDAVLPDVSEIVLGSFKFSGDGCRFTYYSTADCSGTEYCHDLQPETCIAYSLETPFKCENRLFNVYAPNDVFCAGDLAFNTPQVFGDVAATREEDNANAFRLIGQCYDKNGQPVYTTPSSAFSVAAGALVGALYFL